MSFSWEVKRVAQILSRFHKEQFQYGNFPWHRWGPGGSIIQEIRKLVEDAIRLLINVKVKLLQRTAMKMKVDLLDHMKNHWKNVGFKP